ncbi:MAG TPA: ABC transporter permease, partial [Xanthomonadales bacterium]|nr:ABC transporter permease [Xanthomonadales bacterium]
QSLEPLLATPAAREGIMSGKLAATCAFSLASLLLTIVAFKLGFKLVPTGRMGISIDISLAAMVKIYLAVLPIVVFGSCLLTMLAAFSKTVKEAQSYIPLLMLLPMIPTIILLVNPVKTQLWMLAVPFLAQNQLIMMVLRGESIGAAQWAVGVGASLLVAAVIWAVAARLYHREQLAVSV